jgi:hypothetical protein
MSKDGLWKSIFAHREKVSVNVSGRAELLTDTQAFRFKEISEARGTLLRPTYRNPLEDSFYHLEDAALRLMISEDEVLARAAAGGLRLYVNVAGKSGYWCRRDREGNVSQSSVATISSGCLSLRSKACAELAKRGRAIVHTLDLCETNGNSRDGIDDYTLSNLRAWGPGDKQFFPLRPLVVERNEVMLLPQ